MHNNITNIYLGIRTLILCYNGDQGWAARYVHKCLCVCVFNVCVRVWRQRKIIVQCPSRLCARRVHATVVWIVRDLFCGYCTHNIMYTCTLNFHKNTNRDILNTKHIFRISCDVSSFVMKHPRSSDFHHRDDSRAPRTIVISIIYPCVYNHINILVVYTRWPIYIDKCERIFFFF